MRIERAEAVEQLQYAAEAFPHLRLCQIVVNATGVSDPFYVEDERLAECLRDYRRAHADDEFHRTDGGSYTPPPR